MYQIPVAKAKSPKCGLLARSNEDTFMKVYPGSWTAIYVGLDNVGMWNLRTEFWARQYLGQQLYLRVYTASTSIRDEYPIPKNARTCGRASGRRTRPF